MSHVHPVRRMLGVAGFRRLLSVRLVGQWGDGTFQGALFGAAFFNPSRATSAAAAAVAFAVLLVPYSLVGPFAGVVLDRWSRQRVLLVTNLARALLLLGLAASLRASGPTSAPTVTLALLVVSLNRFVLSGLSAALPHVVGARDLVTANALTTTLGTGAAAVGGVGSLGLRALWGSSDAGAARVAAAAVLGYLVAAVLATRLRQRSLGPDAEFGPTPLRHAFPAVARGLAEGALHLRQRRTAAQALLTLTAHRFFSGALLISTLLVYTPHGYLHRGLSGLGQVLTGAVVGGVLAALLTPRVVRRIGPQAWIVLAVVASGIVTVTVLPWWQHPSMVLGGAALGFAAQAAKICVDTLVQADVEDDYRGRCFSLYDAGFNLSFVAAASLAAALVPDSGRSTVLLLVVASSYAGTALLYRRACLTAAAAAGSAPAAGWATRSVSASRRSR